MGRERGGGGGREGRKEGGREKGGKEGGREGGREGGWVNSLQHLKMMHTNILYKVPALHNNAGVHTHWVVMF